MAALSGGGGGGRAVVVMVEGSETPVELVLDADIPSRELWSLLEERGAGALPWTHLVRTAAGTYLHTTDLVLAACPGTGPARLECPRRKECRATDGIDSFPSFQSLLGRDYANPTEALVARAAQHSTPASSPEDLREAIILYDQIAARALPLEGEDPSKFVSAHLELQRCCDRLKDVEGCRVRAQAVVDAARVPFWTHRLQRPPHLAPALLSRPWHDTAELAWCAVLEKNFPLIKAEFEAFVASPGAMGSIANVSTRDQDLAGGRDRWRQCDLAAGAACPRTAAILKKIPAIADCARRGLGQMLFSILAPKAKLRPHCGPTNARLTMHMGIIVPPGGSWIRAGEERREWREGKCLVFDDSWEHEVEVRDGPRVVLLCNFWHPDIQPSDWDAVADAERAVREGAGGTVVRGAKRGSH